MSISLRNPSNDPVPNRFYGDAPVKGISIIWHNGNDYGWGQGKQVYAAAAGRVIARRWSSSTPRNNRSGGYGNYIIIDHGNGYSTLYAHLPNSNPMVNIGQQVTAGERIGTMGNTGNASGDHLHFELRLNGRITDPNPYFGSATAATNQTPVEEDDMYTDADRTRDDIVAWQVNRIKENIDALSGGKGAVHAKLDVILWALADPEEGLRKMVAGASGTVPVPADVTAIASAVDAALADNFDAIPGAVVGGFKAAL